MTSPQPGAPVVQRSCALCGVVDGGPRNIIALPSGRDAFYHLPGSPDCTVANADPHPEFEETAGCSQQRHALTHDPQCVSPSPVDYIPTTITDAQQAGTSGTWIEGFAPGTEPLESDLDPGTER